MPKGTKLLEGEWLYLTYDKLAVSDDVEKSRETCSWTACWWGQFHKPFFTTLAK